MTESSARHSIGILIALGSVWGLSEAALGMGLRSCASMVSGSIMTGVALFFMAAGWIVSKKYWGVFLMVIIAALFKMFDALLLSLPLNHGAVGNPIFAFFMEALALLVLLSLLKEKLTKKPSGQALLGGLAAVLAVNLFPLVRYATEVPACVAPGTDYPLSLYYIHFAVLISFISVPLGFGVGSKISAFLSRPTGIRNVRKIEQLLSPAALLLSLLIITFLRLI
jgi:hypothetical protein